MRRFLLMIVMMASLPLSGAQAAILVLVTSISDFTLPTWSIGDPAITANMDMCVYATGLLPGGYSIKASSTGGYVLKSGAKSLNYQLSWDDGGHGNLGLSSTPLTNNVALSGRGNANIISPVCITGPNARLKLGITQANMQAALAGTYTGTVTLLVSAN